MTAARDWSGVMAGFSFVMAWACVGAGVAEGWARDWAPASLWLVGAATWLWVRRLWQRLQRRRAEQRRWHAYWDARWASRLRAGERH